MKGARRSPSRGRQAPLAPRRFPRPFSLTRTYSSTWPFTMARMRPCNSVETAISTSRGTVYAPTAAVTFQGDPTISLSSGTRCGEIIAASLAFNGNATFNDTGCPAAEVPTSQYVALVQ